MIEIDKNKQMHPTNLNQLSCLQGRVGELREQFIRFCFFFLIGINSIQGRTASTRHGVTRKRNIKRLQHTENLFRKNLQLKMSVNSRLIVTKIIGQRKAFCIQRIPGSNCARKETVDTDILVTSRNGDRKNLAIYQNNE